MSWWIWVLIALALLAAEAVATSLHIGFFAFVALVAAALDAMGIGEPLWAQLRLNVGAFLQTLFRQGAFQGQTPRDAYFVKCDRETTTQADVDLGIVNIVVGFAPLKPAEFVVIQLQQLAGQRTT